MLGEDIKVKYLLRIKSIIDKDINGSNFTIVRTAKNMEFMREYSLRVKDVKNIIKALAIEDCFSGPEMDRDSQYSGWIFKFSPKFDNIKLYIKIRVENKDKAVCISVHEFGLYNEVN